MPLFVFCTPLPLNFNSKFSECKFCKFSHCVIFTSCKYKIFGFFVVKNTHHSFTIFGGITPVPFCIKVTKGYSFLFPYCYKCCSPCYFFSNKCFTSPGRFMIKQDTVTGKNIICFPVVNYYPIAVKFCDSIWRAWIKGSGFRLGYFPYFSA